MTAKEYFNKIQKLEKYIELKKQRAEIFREIAGSPSSSRYSDMPRPPQRRSLTPMADAIYKALELEDEIKEDELKLNQMKVEALDTIGQIPNTKYQQILIGRYFEHLSWDKLIDKVLYERRYLYKMHGKALYFFEKMMAERKKTLKDT